MNMKKCSRFAAVFAALVVLFGTVLFLTPAESSVRKPWYGTSTALRAPGFCAKNPTHPKCRPTTPPPTSPTNPTPSPTETPTTTTTPSPTPTATPTATPTTPTGAPKAADFPTATSVGPATTPTTVYTGSCSISQSGLIIDAKVLNCASTGVRIEPGVTGVMIRNSIVNGGVTTSFGPLDPEALNDDYPTVFTIENSRVIQPFATGGIDRGVCCSHFTVRNSYLQGTHSGGLGINKTTLIGNFITTDGTDTHQSGFRMNRNSTMRDNTVTCKPVGAGYEASGCSAHAVFYREWGTPVNLTLVHNYWRRGVTSSGQGGGPYAATRFIDCERWDDCVNIVFTDNLFSLGEGADAGEFPNDVGDVWARNYWTDGTTAESGESNG